MSLAFERGKLVVRERLEEAVGHLELAPVGAELALRPLRRNGGEARHWCLAAHDDDLLARRGTQDQAGEVRLGGMYGYGRHGKGLKLANDLSQDGSR